MRYFLILGNTRVGSTWLQTCLHALPGVFCIRETRWRMPYQEEDWWTHTYIDHLTRSMKERLDHGRGLAGVQDVVATGAKFKVDPYWYVLPDAFNDLGKIIEEDVYVIMVRRSYFEIFETWKAFGIRHLANPSSRQSMLRKRLTMEGFEQEKWVDRFFADHSAPLTPKKVFITRAGKSAFTTSDYLNDGNECPEDIVHCDIDDAVSDLLVLFYNDVNMWNVLRERPQADLLDYREIEARFYSISQRILPDVTRDECQQVLANSATRKMEMDGVRRVFPNDALREISEYLMALFDAVKAGELPAEDIVRYDAGRKAVEFSIPNLQSILEKHEETNGLRLGLAPSGRLFRRLFARDIKTERWWVARRPVYLPTRHSRSRLVKA